MKVFECRGTHRDIGRTIGEVLREEIRSHINGFLPPENEAPNRKIDKFRESLARFLPEVLEQFEGMAEASGIPERRILELNLPVNIVIPDLEQECSNIVFADGPDGPLWGKNNDGNFPPNTGPVVDGKGRRPVALMKIYPNDGIPAICLTFCGWLSGGDMMNAEGVAVGHSSVGTSFQQSLSNAPLLQWLYSGMFQYKSAEDLARHVTSTALRGKGFTLAVVDKGGNMFSAELACPLAQIRRPADGDLAMNCVNHYQLPCLKDMVPKQRDQKSLANSRERQKYLEAAVKDGDRSIEHMKKILRHHGDISICRHGGKDLAYTEYSMIGVVKEGKFLFVDGYPCEKEYLEVTF